MKNRLISIMFLTCFCLLFVFGLTGTVTSYALSKEEYKAKSLFLMDYNTNQVLFEKDSNIKIPVASIVKLMTICLTCEEIDAGNIHLDDIVIASNNAASMGGSQVFIEEGGEYSIEDLLKSTIVASANDASVALAEKIAGTESDFVVMMNKKANQLGMSNTNYVNCTGLPASNQFSCARDTAILLKEVTKHDVYHKYSTIWMDTIKHPQGRECELVNTNKLIRYFEGCDGGKTGSTNEAGYCLSATAKRGNMRLIAVVLGAESGKSRFAETSKLLNYGFANFKNKLIVDSSLCLEDKVNITDGTVNNISVKPQEDLYALTQIRQDNTNVTTMVKTNLKIKAPIKKGDVVGKIYVLKDGVVIAETNLLSMQDVNKTNIYYNFVKTINNWKII